MKLNHSKAGKTETLPEQQGLSGMPESREHYIEAWQHLIDTDTCWQLQGWFGRTASQLISVYLIKLNHQLDPYGLNFLHLEQLLKATLVSAPQVHFHVILSSFSKILLT